MKTKVLTLLIVAAFAVMGSAGCATKKFVRARVNERVTPLENRTGELEETSRRNSQDIARINDAVTDVRGRADRAQTQADTALARAEEASTRAGAAEQSVGDLRSNLDNYALQNTATVNFAFDSYELTPEARAALDRVAEQIKDRNNFILEIQGFADARGTETYNNQLTEKRADTVRRYLAERYNIALFRMHVLGFGSLRAVADNGTPEGRAQNRRVEVRLLTRNVAATQTTRASQRQSSN